MEVFLPRNLTLNDMEQTTEVGRDLHCCAHRKVSCRAGPIMLSDGSLIFVCSAVLSRLDPLKEGRRAFLLIFVKVLNIASQSIRLNSGNKLASPHRPIDTAVNRRDYVNR